MYVCVYVCICMYVYIYIYIYIYIHIYVKPTGACTPSSFSNARTATALLPSGFSCLCYSHG